MLLQSGKGTVLHEAIPVERFSNFIFDIGDVILSWDPEHSLSKGKRGDLRRALRHPLWEDFEKGRVREETAYTQVACELGMSYEELLELVRKSRQSVRVRPGMPEFLEELRLRGKRTFCLTNMDHGSFLHLFSHHDFWRHFEQIYVSSLLQLRKPEADVFRFVLEHASLDPRETLFLDNDDRNLASATELGLGTVKFSGDSVVFRDNDRVPVPLNGFANASLREKREKACQYLFGRLERQPLCRSFVAYDMELVRAEDFSAEIFSTIMALDTCSALPAEIRKAMLEEIRKHGHESFRWCFYKEEARPEDFPHDLDTTSMALSVFLRENRTTLEKVAPVVDAILANRDDEGVIRVYFSEKRPRVDPAVCVNVLYLLCQLGMGDREDLRQTREHIFQFLKSGGYAKGTRYYPSPEAFLYFLARLVVDFPEHFGGFAFELKKALVSRIDASPHPIDRASRVIALGRLGIVNRLDFLRLMDAQLSDGGWPMNALFIAYRTNKHFGSRELTTAFALEAMDVMLGKEGL